MKRIGSVWWLPNRLFAVVACLGLFVLFVAAHGANAQGEELTLRANHSATPDVQPISYVAEEGTWISLDVSPDGRTIIFELLGDLYTLPIEGGEAQLIIGDAAFDSQPSYSPDGQHIAFLSDRDGAEKVWIARADGSDARPISDGYWDLFASPTWTPDGDFVVVSRALTGYYGSYQLWMYGVHGGDGVRLTDGAEGRNSALGPAISPDGERIYYALRGHHWMEQAVPFLPIWQIEFLDLITGEQEQLTNAVGSAFRPVLSHNGRYLVYGTRIEGRTQLRIRDFQTQADRLLISPVQRDDQEAPMPTRDTLPGYTFTPDDRSLVLSYGGKIHRVDIESGEATPVPFQATVRKEVKSWLNFPGRVPDSATVTARIIQNPVLSPKGDRVAFTAFRKLYVMDLDSAMPQRVTSTALDAEWEYEPTWSPDGRWLAYTTIAESGEGGLWRVSANGRGKPQRLSSRDAEKIYSLPVWTPDGTKIIAYRAPLNEYRQATALSWAWPDERVWIGDRAGGAAGQELVTFDLESASESAIFTGSGERPHFMRSTPDRMFVFRSNVLQSMNLDGTDVQSHLRARGLTLWQLDPRPRSPYEIRLSPSGRFALIRMDDHWQYIAQLPPGGLTGKITVDVDAPRLPLRRLTNGGADYIDWSPTEDVLVWSVGASLRRLAVTPALLQGDKETPIVVNGAGSPIQVVVERERHRPRGTILLRAGQVITMRGEETLHDGEILVRDNRIVHVGPRATIPVPEGARVVDLPKATIVPGFIDVHQHLNASHYPKLRPQWSSLSALAYGVTTGRDPAGSLDTLVNHDLSESGAMVGPRAFTTGQVIDSGYAIDSQQDMRAVVQKYSQHYQEKTLKSYSVGNREQRTWMLEACREFNLMPTTEGWGDFKTNIIDAMDGFSGVEHDFSVVTVYRDVAEVFAASKTVYTPQILARNTGIWMETMHYTDPALKSDPKVRRFVPPSVLHGRASRRGWVHPTEYDYYGVAAGAAAIVRAGGYVGVGAHGQFDGPDVHWELQSLHAEGHGMTPFEVLRSATLHGATAIGYSADLGSIEAGKLADLVILGSDPLTDIRNAQDIIYVMKNGMLYDGKTLEEQWPKQKPMPLLWWWK